MLIQSPGSPIFAHEAVLHGAVGAVDAKKRSRRADRQASADRPWPRGRQRGDPILPPSIRRFGPASEGVSPRRLPQDPIEIGPRDPVKKAKKGVETQGSRAREARALPRRRSWTMVR